MSLFGSIHMANTSLNAAQLGLQVVGNNIANANTPGYMRQEIVLASAKAHEHGDLLMGLGVGVEGIVQRVDRFLDEQLRSANSDLASGEAQQEALQQLESLIGELGEDDLSTSMSKFFNSINDILNQPESRAVRNLAVLQGKTLAADIRHLATRVQAVRRDINDRIVNSAGEINQLLKEVAKFNVQVSEMEGGGTRGSDAVGLRDARREALRKLSEIMDIRAVEQADRTVTVFSEGDYLVSQGIYREVTVAHSSDRGVTVAEIQLADTQMPINSASGKLAGWRIARDDLLGGFLHDLDNFAQTLSFEFNRVYSTGQGLSGYTELTSTYTVDNPDAALDSANLPFTPVNGSFQVHVHNKQTGQTKTTDVFVSLNGLDDDTTLHDVAATIDAAEGISAEVTRLGGLKITSDVPNIEFTFGSAVNADGTAAGDTSGLLAALGIGTFFTGRGSLDINVNEKVQQAPMTFSASQGGVGKDTKNAALLAGFLDRKLDSQGGVTLSNHYQQMAGDVMQTAALTKSTTNGHRVFQQTLEAQQLAVSGVNIDEEAVKMLTFQRMYQATARYISTVNKLLDMLVQL